VTKTVLYRVWGIRVTGGTVKGVVDQIVVSIRSYPGSGTFPKILALYDIELGRIVM
jgi:hypothetical protein